MEKMEKMVLKYDYTTEIVVTKRTHDYHACIRGHPEIWGCGRNESEAIGDVVRSHESEFGVKINCGRQKKRHGFYVVRCSSCGFEKCVGISPAIARILDAVKKYELELKRKVTSAEISAKLELMEEICVLHGKLKEIPFYRFSARTEIRLKILELQSELQYGICCKKDVEDTNNAKDEKAPAGNV